MKNGTGTSFVDLVLSPGAFTELLKAWYIYQLIYLVTLWFIKVSILYFYKRLSPKRSYQIAIKVVAVVVTLYTIAMLLVNVSITLAPQDPARMHSLTASPSPPGL